MEYAEFRSALLRSATSAFLCDLRSEIIPRRSEYQVCGPIFTGKH